MHLSDYQIASYIDKKVNKKEEKMIKEHLNSCKQCFEKAFFIKKVIIEEEKSKKEKKNTVIENIKNKIKLLKSGIEIISKSSKIDEFTLAFRDETINKKAIEVKTDPPIKIIYDEKIKIVPIGDIKIEIITDGKIIFKGVLLKDFEINIEKEEINNKFILKTEKETIEFEIDV